MTEPIAMPLASVAVTDQILVRRPGSDDVYYISCANLLTQLYATIGAASASAAGAVELATSAETITGTDDARAVTPADLAAKVASSTAQGIVELATAGETLAGSDTDRAVTAADVRAVMGKLRFVSFAGHNNTGACTAVGVSAGDMVLYVAGITAGSLGSKGTLFESVITTADQIQQSSTVNYSSTSFLGVFLGVA